MRIFVLFVATLALVAQSVNGQALNLTETCSETLGYCGPKSICGAYTAGASIPTCVFPATATPDYALKVQATRCKTCTPSSDARCSRAALTAIIKGTGIKAAYCNDAFLVIHTDMGSGFGNTLSKIPNPPGSVDSSGTKCVTREVNTGGFAVVKIPLTTTPLATASYLNNANTQAFPGGGGNGVNNAEYMSNNGVVYGLPTRG
jgi:hypothetical protein